MSISSFSLLQGLESSLIFVVGLWLIIKLSPYFSVEKRIAIFLYLWHSLFCIAYLVYSFYISTDSTTFYLLSFKNTHFGFGTAFIAYILSPFTQYLNFSYITLFSLFNFIGSVALLIFYGALSFLVRDSSTFIRRLVFLTVLLPSLSFWSSAIGKDALSFFAISLMLWSSLDLYRRWYLILFSIVVMFMIRPHMAIIMIIALVIALLLDKNIQYRYKFGFIALASVAISYIMPTVLAVTRLRKLDRVFEYISLHQRLNQDGATSFDLASMNLLSQLFNFIFRPLLYEAYNLFSLALSLENTFLLGLFVYACYMGYKVGFKVSKKVNLVFLSSYLAGAWLILAITLPNYGLIARQKWMVVPVLIFICLIFISQGREKR